MCDLFLLRLAMELDCQFVDNLAKYDPAMPRDVQEWLARKEGKLKVPFVFDKRTGTFTPLVVPTAPVLPS